MRKLTQIFIFLAIFSLFFTKDANAQQVASDNFNSGFGSWSSSVAQAETFICGSACNSVKLSNTSQSSPNARLTRSFTVTQGATYQARVRAGVYTTGADPNGSVTLTANAGGSNQVMYCFNTSCGASGSSIGGTFLTVDIVAESSTLTVYLDGDQGGCIDGEGCHDPYVDDFSLVKTADPVVVANDAATCTNISVNNGNSITTGQTYSASITMRNDGDTTWTSATNYKLGAQDPQDDPNWGTTSGADSGKGTRPTRVSVPSSISPGGTATFDFSTTAPDTAGTYRFAFQMVKDDPAPAGHWFGGKCGPDINVSPAPAADPLRIISCSVSPTTANTGQEVTWTGTAVGGIGTHTYTWTGDDGLSGTGTRTVVSTFTPTTHSVNKSYSSAGTKNGRVRVTSTDGQDTGFVNCTNSVTITAPDLIIDSLSPASAVAGSSVSFSGRVRNTGTVSAGASSTRLRYDSNKDGTLDTTLTNQPTGALAAGGSETETWPAVTFSTAGNYLFEICADIGAVVYESSEDNNCTSQTFTVTQPAQPNLEVDPLTSISVQAGDSVSPSATVRNSGTASTIVSSITRLRIDTNKDGDYTDTADILSNQTTRILFSAEGTDPPHTFSSVWTPSSTGTYNYQICADATNAVTTESDESDNCQTSFITVSSPGTPPAPTIIVVTTNGCIDPGYTGGGVLISWNGTWDWADIDTDLTFAEPYYHKGVSRSTSTTAPNGFNAFPSGGSLSLNPDTPYFVRLYNEQTKAHSDKASFSIPACPQPAAAFDYSLANSGNITAAAGQVGSNNILAGLLSGSSQSVAFSPSGLPSNTTYQFSPQASCSPTCTRGLSIQTTGSTPVDTYPITIIGASSGVANKFTGFNLIVNPPPPGGGLPPTVDLKANLSDTPVTITHTGTANLSWTTTQNPQTCTASGAWFGSKAPGGGAESTVSLSGPASYLYNLTCRNTAGSNADSVIVNVLPPGASPGPSPSPGASPGPSPSPGPVCGDLICTLPETVATCPTDCGLLPPCGDGICSVLRFETTLSCPADCPVIPPGPDINRPWIQTTGGDVHSNTGIDTPGGP